MLFYLLIALLFAVVPLVAAFAVFRWDALRYRRRRRAPDAASAELSAGRLHVNHAYLLDLAIAASQGSQLFRVLDYGCGAGEVVEVGRRRGLSIYGADLFTDAASPYRDAARQRGLLGDAIREIRDDGLEFPDAFFDFAICNQVFEHVEHLDATLNELARVIKPGGKLVCLFPSREVVREGHIGVPIAHWFPKRSDSAIRWVTACRSMGLGYVKDTSVSPKNWARKALHWVDENTFYRTTNELLAAFGRHFRVQLREEDNLRFRLSSRGKAFLSRLVVKEPLASLARVGFRRAAGLVVVGTRLSASIAVPPPRNP